MLYIMEFLQTVYLTVHYVILLYQILRFSAGSKMQKFKKKQLRLTESRKKDTILFWRSTE